MINLNPNHVFVSLTSFVGIVIIIVITIYLDHLSLLVEIQINIQSLLYI